jgi:diguanylate cyclase (GGDEF)-like protein
VRRRIADLRIAAKIVIITFTVAAIFAAAGAFGLFKIYGIVQTQDRQYHVNVAALDHMTKVQSADDAQLQAVFGFLSSGSAPGREPYAAAIAATDREIDSHMAALRSLDLPATEQATCRAFAASVVRWRAVRNDALDAARTGDRQQAATLLPSVRAYSGKAAAVVAALVAVVAESARLSMADSERTARLVSLIQLAGVIVSILLSILTARAISRPLGEVVDVLARVARGDLSRRVHLDRNDEIGRMAGSLDETLNTLRRAFDKISHHASHDSLTGLANRALLRERIIDAGRNAADGGLVAMLLVDLDGFKQINDGHGHAAGDHVLSVVAARLVAGVRGGDTVARLGGDEFAVLLDGMAEPGDEYTVAQHLLAELQKPIEYQETSLAVGASIGVSIWNGRTPVDALLQDADEAMYAAKAGGKSCVVLAATLHAA